MIDLNFITNVWFAAPLLIILSAIFATPIAVTLVLIKRWHALNGVHHRDDIDRLLAIARSDKH